MIKYFVVLENREHHDHHAIREQIEATPGGYSLVHYRAPSHSHALPCFLPRKRLWAISMAQPS